MAHLPPKPADIVLSSPRRDWKRRSPSPPRRQGPDRRYEPRRSPPPRSPPRRRDDRDSDSYARGSGDRYVPPPADHYRGRDRDERPRRDRYPSRERDWDRWSRRDDERPRRRSPSPRPPYSPRRRRSPSPRRKSPPPRPLRRSRSPPGGRYPRAHSPPRRSRTPDHKRSRYERSRTPDRYRQSPSRHRAQDVERKRDRSPPPKRRRSLSKSPRRLGRESPLPPVAPVKEDKGKARESPKLIDPIPAKETPTTQVHDKPLPTQPAIPTRPRSDLPPPPSAILPEIPPWKGKTPLTPELEAEWNRLRQARMTLEAENFQNSMALRRAQHELDLAMIDLKAAEQRRKFADEQLEHASLGMLGVDSELPPIWATE